MVAANRQTLRCKTKLFWLIMGLFVICPFIHKAGFNNSASAASAQPTALSIAKQARQLAAKGHLHKALNLTRQALLKARQEYGPEHEYTGYMLDDMATYHYRLSQFHDALPLARQALGIIGARRGEVSKAYASMANNLATVLLALGHFHDAEKYYRQALSIFQREPGARQQSVQTARNLGIVYLEMSRFGNAKQHFNQALKALQESTDVESAEAGRLHLNLAQVYLREEDLQQARAQGNKALAIFSRQNTAPIQDTVQADVILARIDIHESKLTRALDKLTYSLKILDEAPARHTLARASVLYNLGFVFILKGQLVEAEPVYKQVMNLYRLTVSENHPAIARTLHSLAIVYKNLGKFEESERLYQRALSIFQSSFGEDDASVAATRLEYGLLLTEQGETDRAIEQAKKALSIYRALPGDWRIKTGYAKSSSGFALHRAGRLEEAAQAFEQATKLMAEVRGQESSDLPPGLTQLGEIYMKQQRYSASEAALKHAIRIREKDAALTPEGLAKSLAAMARLRVLQGRPGEALEIANRYLDILQDRLGIARHSLSASSLDEQRESRDLFEQYLTIAQAVRGRHGSEALITKMFKAAQFPHLSGTAAAITGMAARFAPDQTALGKLLRQRQDAVEQWRATDNTLTERLGGVTSPSAERLNRNLKQKLRRLSDHIRQLDTRLQQEFPEFSELTNPRPVSLKKARNLLKEDEALFLQITGSRGSDLFLLRHDHLQVTRTPMNAQDLKQAVDSVRKSVDLQRVTHVAKLPEFDTGNAHYLYRQLFHPFREELKGVRHIIAVFDGAMQNLPPTLLLRSRPTGNITFSAYSRMDFLGREFSFSVVPSVSSFKALREQIKPSRATQPFVGFGNPVFHGAPSRTRGIQPETLEGLVTLIDPTFLNASFVPLPETRQELEALASTLNATGQALYLSDKATERMVKKTRLSQYKVIAFATHGLLAGEFRGLAEPALVFTPPSQASVVDDGLLTASEIARLKLDADWVILSACNTAGPGGRPGAEGLSGLAKAFFYAGSRALLVSHWAVSSNASELLTTGAVKAITDHPKIGRAEALRLSTLALLDQQEKPYFAHPAFWAPFITVGEGGRRKALKMRLKQ